MTERVFTMELAPNGTLSKVFLDGVDISGLLRGVKVTSGVGQPTTVELMPSRGQRVSLIAKLPEAQIVVAEEASSR